jgi:hypothetical protein
MNFAGRNRMEGKWDEKGFESCQKVAGKSAGVKWYGVMDGFGCPIGPKGNFLHCFIQENPENIRFDCHQKQKRWGNEWIHDWKTKGRFLGTKN